MTIDPDRLKRMTESIVGDIEKRRSNSEARMAVYNAAAPEKVISIKEDGGPAGSLDGMGQVAGNLRGPRPESPEEAADKLRMVNGKWVRED